MTADTSGHDEKAGAAATKAYSVAAHRGASCQVAAPDIDPRIVDLLQRIVDQIAETDLSNREGLADLRERIARVAEQTNLARARAPRECAAAFDRIEEQLAMISEKVDAARKGRTLSLPERPVFNVVDNIERPPLTKSEAPQGIIAQQEPIISLGKRNEQPVQSAPVIEQPQPEPVPRQPTRIANFGHDPNRGAPSRLQFRPIAEPPREIRTPEAPSAPEKTSSPAPVGAAKAPVAPVAASAHAGEVRHAHEPALAIEPTAEPIDRVYSSVAEAYASLAASLGSPIVPKESPSGGQQTRADAATPVDVPAAMATKDAGAALAAPADDGAVVEHEPAFATLEHANDENAAQEEAIWHDGDVEALARIYGDAMDITLSDETGHDAPSAPVIDFAALAARFFQDRTDGEAAFTANGEAPEAEGLDEAVIAITPANAVLASGVCGTDAPEAAPVAGKPQSARSERSAVTRRRETAAVDTAATAEERTAVSLSVPSTFEHEGAQEWSATVTGAAAGEATNVSAETQARVESAGIELAAFLARMQPDETPVATTEPQVAETTAEPVRAAFPLALESVAQAVAAIEPAECSDAGPGHSDEGSDGRVPAAATVKQHAELHQLIGELSGRIGGMERRLDELADARVGAETLRTIEVRLDELKTQHDRALSELARLTVMEGALDKLMTSIESIEANQPDWTALAEAVAERVVMLQPQRVSGDQGLPSEAVQTLLGNFVEERRREDGQVTAMLSSLQTVVADLVARFDAYDQDASAGYYEAEQGYEVEAPLQPAHDMDRVSEPDRPKLTTPPTTILHGDHAVSQSSAAMAETVADAQATVDQGESGRHDDPPAVEPEPHGGRQPISREELVAAARRAAHAASRQQPAAPERSGPVAARPSRAPVAQARRGGLLANQRPVLIVAVVALLAAGAGMLYGKLTKGSHQAPAARIEQSVAPGKQSAVETLEHEDVTVGGFSVTDPAADAAATVAPTPVAVPPSDTQAEPSAVAPIAGAGAQESALDLPPATIGPLSLRLAAAQGDSEAQIEIADRYAAGNGVERDLGKAAEWYQRAASAGNARAQYRLASLYERGRGVEKDLGRARVWYQRAAEQGNVKAMHNLGVLYTGQAGTEPDYATAAKWFAKAAEYGLADSQFNLAILYENGLGVARSTPEAYKWYALAAKRGDTEAAKRRDMVRGRLSPSAVAKIDNALKSWRPLEPGPGNDQAAVGAVLTQPEASADPSSQVIAVQSMLNRLGYDAGPVDGILASRTTEAIRRFQKRSGLPETGEISDELLVALKDLAG